MRGRRRFDAGGVLTLLVLAVFTAAILAVLLGGAGIVRRLTARDDRSFEYRTASQYISARVRRSDSAGMISIGSFGDGDALILTEEIEGALYNTLIYCHDGSLYELFCRKGLEMEPQFGEQLIPLDGLILTDRGDSIEATLTHSEGWEETLLLTLRSERGADR